MEFKQFVLVFLASTCAVTARTQAPNPPANPNPQDQATSGSVNPTLCASVSDPNGGSLQVRYFGKKKTANGLQKFSIVLLPDTQYYTEQPQSANGGNISMFTSQTNWIANNRESRNIVYVGHLGDCVQNGDNPPGIDNEIEWRRADAAMKTIEDPNLTGLPQGIPYGVCVGNHDQTPFGSATGTTTYYNQYFGSDRFNNRYYYGGHHASNNDNHFQVFSVNGINFLVISFEYDQSPGFSASGGALDWAEALVQTYPAHQVIVMTHYAMNENTSFSTQGQAIYNRLKVYSNFRLLLAGHVHTSDGEARRTDIYNGNAVHTLLSDYQGRTGGGNGLLRLLEFDPAASKLSVKTYSPFTNSFETDADSQFDLDFNLLPPIGNMVNASSGSTACETWNNLFLNSEYIWNMEVFDGQNITIGPIWSFHTPFGAPLPLSLLNFSANVIGKKVRLDWSAANETTNNRFEIERSSDGMNFLKIGDLAGSTNPGGILRYHYTDAGPRPGKNYYRLRQEYVNGESGYSKTIRVVCETGKNVLVSMEPGSRSVRIHLRDPQGGTLRIEFYDMLGRSIYSEIRQNNSNEFMVQPLLRAGTYLLRLVPSEGPPETQMLLVPN